ncbi:MAG: NUDIX domain-containing protein [Bacteroidota bacterium]|nr:NUDIX domain-containing protein [Bacteroidota bacterium]
MQIEEYIPNLSLDCVVFGYSERSLKVLISRNKFGKKNWELLGGYIRKTESVEKAAARVLQERTGLKKVYLEQFRVFGNENRIIGSRNKNVLKEALRKYDPRRFNKEVVDWMTDRFVCIGFYALLDINRVVLKNGEFDEYLEWRSIDAVPEMIYDHNEILETGLASLREHLDSKLIAFNLLPETFTMRDLQALYEAVYERPFAMNNFQKKMLSLGVLERLEKKYTGAQNKAPYLYRFKGR